MSSSFQRFLQARLALRREIFYLPLFTASVGASLFASRRVLPLVEPLADRRPCHPVGVGDASPRLEPRNPAITGIPACRLLAIAFCLMLVPGAMLLRGVPDDPILVVIALLSLTAAIAPAWGYVQVHAAIETLYRQPLALGWGFWLGTGGFLAAAFISIAEAIRG